MALHTVEARRFLHCCYCCDDLSSAIAFLTDGLDLHAFMQTAPGLFDGTVLGFERPVEATACFVYDQRGARTSPAIEVQAWIDPPAAGEPHTSPLAIGVQALGCATGDLTSAVANVERAGASVIGESAGSPVFDAASATIRDPNGITFDLVEGDAVAGATRLAHLRIHCRDLDASIAWYQRLGFSLQSRRDDVLIDSSVLGVGGHLSVAELTLPDEPMRLLLIQWLDPAPTGAHYPVANHRGIYRVAIGVDDTRVAARVLEAEGVAITHQPALLELKGTPVPDMWIAFLTDPDGVPVELVERPRSAFREVGRHRS